MGNRTSSSSKTGGDNYEQDYLSSLPEETKLDMDDASASNDGDIEDEEMISVASPLNSNKPGTEGIDDNLNSSENKNKKREDMFHEDRSGIDMDQGRPLLRLDGEDDDDTVAKSDNESEGDLEENRDDESDQDDNSDGAADENNDPTSGIDDNSDGDPKHNPGGASDNDENSDGEIDDNPESTGGRKVELNSSRTGSGGNSVLDEATLQAIKTVLSQGAQEDTLDEDEVAMNAVKTSRYANERTRYRQNVLEGSDQEEETFYARVYREEESYALSNEFFKSVTNEAQNQAAAEINDDSDDFQMDKRTLNWLKRAAGLVRPYDPMDTYESKYLSEDDEPEGDTDSGDKQAAPRRMTRGLARSTRVKRREQRIRIENQGLTALMEAVLDLESERGPFVEKEQVCINILFREHPISCFGPVFFLDSRHYMNCLSSRTNHLSPLLDHSHGADMNQMTAYPPKVEDERNVDDKVAVAWLR